MYQCVPLIIKKLTSDVKYSSCKVNTTNNVNYVVPGTCLSKKKGGVHAKHWVKLF